MPSRYKSRQTALQILYLRDMRQEPLDELLQAFYGSLASDEAEAVSEHDGFAEELVNGAIARLEEIDKRIAERSEHWRVERMPIVDRNILRLGIYELLALPTPAAVVIDQALELAKRFSSDESIPFINGVLDAVNLELHK
jgi:N utilization substance protein B